MSRFPLLMAVALLFVVSLADPAAADRVLTNPETVNSDPDMEFHSIALAPDGSIIAVANLNPALAGNRDQLVSIPAPPIPQIDPVDVTQLSTKSISVSEYDADFTPVISPNGQTILFEHDGSNRSSGVNTIYQVPITGESHVATQFNGLFAGTSGGNNRVTPGVGNGNPQYSPNGNTIFFLNFNSGFGGTVPSFSGDNAFRGGPSWNQIYSVPAVGGTPTPITLPGNGSIDRDLWAVTPNGASIVYAPDVPLVAPQIAGDKRTKLFSTPTTGGTPTEIPLTPSTQVGFSIARQVELTPDGSQILFIGDYLTGGRQELFSVPITGGTPTRINDNLAFAGDVKSFEISPDGTKVAYAAGQNVSANTELFLKNLNGALGSSIRVSDPPALGGAPGNGGQPDVAETAGRGTILFSNDGSRIFYRGDMFDNGVFDLYSVDTTAKGGLVPSAYTFMGPSGGNFFDESNWLDAQGNTAPFGTINPNADIAHSLIIPANVSVTSGNTPGRAQFVQGGSLEMFAGSSLNITTNNGGGGALGLNFQDGTGLKVTNATIFTDSGIQLSGETSIIDSTLTAGGAESDLYFDQVSDSFISGSTLTATDVLGFESSTPTILNSNIVAEAFSLKFESQISIRDTQITTTGGEIQAASDDRADNTLLRLMGTSEVTSTSLCDGVSAVLDDSSVLTLSGGY